MLLTNSIIAVTDFRKHPFMNKGEETMAVMKNNKPAYYTVSPERMEQLIKAEEKLKELNS